MSILVTGSVAFDHIMVFEDQFKNHILPDKVHELNVSFLVPTLDKRWGGTAANIAYNLRILEEAPIVLATAGQDFGPYRKRFDECGIRTDGVRVFQDAMTAQAFITTDLDDNQITAFHPGAMERAHEAPIAALADVDSISLGIVAPNGKQAMVDHARELKARGIPCVVDPGQGLPLFAGPELLTLLEGAVVYVVNHYEWALTLDKTGKDEAEIAERVGAVVVTRGDQGSLLLRGGLGTVELEAERSEVPAVRAERVVDPTGCGDSYRAGLLHALHRGLPLEVGAKLGSLFGALKVALAGPQSIPLDPGLFRARYEREFGKGF
jgi:adenosine kinase